MWSHLARLAMDKLDDYRIQEESEFLGVSPNAMRSWGQED
jgi:hypothetical protein